MITLFNKLTSGKPEVRKLPISHESSDLRESLGNPFIHPLWVQICPRPGSRVKLSYLWKELLQREHQDKIKRIMRIAPQGTRQLIFDVKKWQVWYSFCPWVPATAWNALPFQVARRTPLLYSPDSKPSLFNCLESPTPKIKAFGLREAVRYSDCRDMRFILCLCAMIGFSVWWMTAPAPLLFKPLALCSPDPGLLVRAVHDTFTTHICCSHPEIVSPCACGEPLNTSVRELFVEPRFDPLGIDPTNRSARLSALSTYLACIILCIALAESVSAKGVYLPLE